MIRFTKVVDVKVYCEMTQAGLTSEPLEALTPESALLIARFFQVLSDPTRVRLVKALADGEWCVSELVEALAMDQPAVSHQLKYLRRLGLVQWQKNGRHVYYTLDNKLLRSTLLVVLDTLKED